MKTKTFKNMPTYSFRGQEMPQYRIFNQKQWNLGFVVYDETGANGVPKEIFYHTSETVAEKFIEEFIKDNSNAVALGKKLLKETPLTPLPPQIIKFEEKHGDANYLYTSREQFYRIFLTVFLERYNEGWYEEEIEEPVNDVKQTPAEIEEIEDKEYRELLKTRLKKFERKLVEYNEAKRRLSYVERAVKENSGQIAFSIMRERDGAEYEGFEKLDLIVV